MKKNSSEIQQEAKREPILFGYTRVSTEKQNTDVQKYEIEKYCKQHGLTVHRWIDEKISGTKDPEKRNFGKILRQMEHGDSIICTEVSRLGRSLQSIWKISMKCVEKGVNIISIKEGHIFNSSTTAKFMLTVFGYAAEIERNLISLRTKEALEGRRRAGVTLGRPVGAKAKKYKLDEYKDKIKQLLDKGTPKSKIAKRFKVNVSTIYSFINRNFPEYYHKDNSDMVPRNKGRFTARLSPNFDSDSVSIG